MHWVSYTEVQGLYAAVALRTGLTPPDRPVAVLREGRVFDGCRAAFASGLILGTPARQVLRDAPRAVTVELAELDTASVARTWWEQCLLHTPYIEPCESHQLFLGLPALTMGLSGLVRTEATRLHEAAAAHGFVAFTGVASSRLAARAAALAAKQGWLLRRPGQAGSSTQSPTLIFVQPGEEARFLAPLPIAYLPSPPEMQRRLNRLGVHSIGEVARISEGEWLRQLGPLGRQLALWSRGIDPEPVKPCYPPRTLKRRVEFTGELSDHDRLEQAICRSAAVLATELAAKGEGCQQTSLLLERAGGPPVGQVRTLARLQQAVWPLQQAFRGLLRQALTEAGESTTVTALTAELGLIGPMPWRQLDLWDDSGSTERQERLQQALSLLHERFPVRMAGLGLQGAVSWREQMLQFADPYRWGARGAG